MARKSRSSEIKFAELKRRAKMKSLSKDELAAYFMLDADKGVYAPPLLKLNLRTVDLGKTKPSQEEITEIHALAMGKVAAPAAIPPVKKLAAPKTKPRIVVEGDSWFRLPFWYPKDVVDYLNEDFDINPLAMWGDTLENIFAQKQYLQVLGAGLRHHLLLSGGGNDVLGSINKYVDKRKAGDTNAKTASKYVRPQFETVIKKLIGYYRGIVVEVRSRINEPVTIYLHGYACAIPRQGGKYLGGPLKKLGFDPDEHAGMCAEIVRHMINRFNEELAKLASSQARVVYVDLRPAFTSKNDWHDDEIHPSSKGARKAATVLRNSINANLAVA